jgi:hypothetical protein
VSTDVVQTMYWPRNLGTHVLAGGSLRWKGWVWYKPRPPEGMDLPPSLAHWVLGWLDQSRAVKCAVSAHVKRAVVRAS